MQPIPTLRAAKPSAAFAFRPPLSSGNVVVFYDRPDGAELGRSDGRAACWWVEAGEVFVTCPVPAGTGAADLTITVGSTRWGYWNLPVVPA